MPITASFFGDRGKRRAESLGIDPQRLPPGQSPTTKWPVLSYGATPRVSTEQFRLRVDGAVLEPFELDWAGLMELQQSTWKDTDIHCVTRWSQFAMTFTGVELPLLLARAQPLPQATHVMAHSFDGYSTNLPLDDLLQRPAMVAHHAEGAPLTADHGGPARLLVPHLYLWKSAKWLNRIELLDGDQLGFWERNGYHHRGDPWHEERYSVPEYVAKARRREIRAGEL